MVEERIEQLKAGRDAEAQPARFDQALVRAVDMAAFAYSRDGSGLGVATGFVDLDRVISGFEPSQLILLGSRAGMGKTSLATGIAYNVAKSWKGEIGGDGATRTISGGIVGFFSMDLSAEQLATRVISQQTGLTANKIQTGNISEPDFERIRDVAIELQHLPLYIDDASTLTASQLIFRAKRLKQQRGLDLIIIDNLELLQSAAERSPRGEARKVGQIMSHLKALARELAVPIVLLSQLSTKIDSRTNKHPRLTDLADLSAIERTTDVVLFIYREEYYLLGERPSIEGSYEHIHWITQMEVAHGRAELIVARNKNGRTGIIELYFDGEVGRFDNLETYSQPPRSR